MLVEVHPDDVEEVKKLAAWCFTYAVYKFLRECYKYEFTVPLGIGFKVGKYWGDGTEYSANVFPDKPLEVEWKSK